MGTNRAEGASAAGKLNQGTAGHARVLIACLALAATACNPPSPERSSRTGMSRAAVVLGTAGSFNVLGASTVTNTGPTVITGDLGLSPGTAVTGFPPGLVSGATHVADAPAIQAQSDLNAAWTTLQNEPCQFTLTNPDLTGLTLTPGVYCFSSPSAGLTGALTLDAQNQADAVFVFQIASTLTTASNSSVTRINGGSDCNIFWQIGSSATLGTGTQFRGNILALASITATTGATITGRLLAHTGAVTMDTNTITGCGNPTVVDAGQPAVVDAGGGSTGDGGIVLIDLSCPDAGFVRFADAGVPPTIDAGVVGVDAGFEECDGGEVMIAVDAGVVPVPDAGTPDSCQTDTCCNGATTSCCGGACVDLANDLNNCGSCGNVCGTGDCCHQGVCEPSTH